MESNNRNFMILVLLLSNEATKCQAIIFSQSNVSTLSTVDSCYLGSPRDALKYLEISVSGHIRFAKSKKKTKKKKKKKKTNNHISKVNM